MKRFAFLIVAAFLLSGLSTQAGKSESVTPEQAKGCLSCHEGIESIRQETSPMMLAIKGIGSVHGDPNGCVVCHGGNPRATTKQDAHSGSPETLKAAKGPQMFYLDPGAMVINKLTCGQAVCHSGYPERLEKSLMNTEAGKIQGNLHTWGFPEMRDYNVPWGNYDISDDDGPVPTIGTDQYKKYMRAMITAWPKQFPKSLKQLPNPSVEEIEKDPKLAAVSYQRQPATFRTATRATTRATTRRSTRKSRATC
jgi:hypothetical protein